MGEILVAVVLGVGSGLLIAWWLSKAAGLKNQAELDAMLADADAVRDRLACAFPDDTEAGVKIADRFITSLYASAQPNLADAVGALALEIDARLSGEEIDHHPPTDGMRSTQATDDADYFKEV